MACTTVNIIQEQPSVLTVAPVAGATASVAPAAPAASSVKPVETSVLAVSPSGPSALSVKPVAPSVLTIGEICSVSHGELVVLAAKDGPLRTRDGGFLLLDPATN